MRAGALAAVLFLTLAPAALAGGSFESSDLKLNKIWAQSVQTAQDMLAPGNLTTDWAGRPCAIAVPVVILDGTYRDRCPYIGDESVIDATLDASTPHFDVQRGMLDWFAAHQLSNGSIPSSPIFSGQLVLTDYNGYWLQTLYRYALYSGDLGLVQQVWPNVRRLLDWYAARTGRSGLFVNDLDHLDYGFIRRHGDVVAYFNAQYVLALREAVKLARWMGYRSDAMLWETRANDVSRVFTAAFWDPHAGAFRDTTIDSAAHPQDGNAFAILSGLATPDQAKSALAYLWSHNARSYGNTITDSASWDDHAWGYQSSERVYPFMSYYEVLARFAGGDDYGAVDLIRREWGYMLANGPQSTMWETIGAFGGPPFDLTPSWDAGWSSGAAPALTDYVLGVQPTSPGFATFTVKPHPETLTSASGTVPTPHGDISVSWKAILGKVVVTVKAPPGTKRV
jgi:hypothetical protein